jgi:hypothetical protein
VKGVLIIILFLVNFCIAYSHGDKRNRRYNVNATIPVCFTVKTSEEWAASGLTILAGQPAIETDERGNRLYILVGDGLPANVNPGGVSASPPYTRLRVYSFLEKTLTENAVRLAEDIAELRSAIAAEAEARMAAIAAEAAEREQKIAFNVKTTLADEAASDALPAITFSTFASLLQTMRNALKGLFSNKADIDGPEFTGIPKVPGKTAAAVNDGTLIATEAQVAAERERAAGAEGALADEIAAEAARAAGVEGALATTIDEKTNEKADKNNPVFTGTIDAGGAVFTGVVDMSGAEVEVSQPRSLDPPYSKPGQLATVRDLLDPNSA